MQDFEKAMEDELKTIAALQQRVYPLVSKEANAKQGVPYLIYGSSEGLPDKTLGGYLDSKEVRAELNVIASRYSDMKAITKRVIALLMSFEGRQIGTGGPHIEEVVLQQPVEIYENQPGLYRCVVEYSAYFAEED